MIWISQFTVAVWAWADKGHCRTNCEIHGDEILDTCSWKLCNHYSFMHSMIHRWKYSLKRGNKGYLCSTSIDVGVMISKCTKWDLFMFLRSVDIRGHCSNVLTVNWSISPVLLSANISIIYLTKHDADKYIIILTVGNKTPNYYSTWDSDDNVPYIYYRHDVTYGAAICSTVYD